MSCPSLRGLGLVTAVSLACALAATRRAAAEEGTVVAFNERCANRLSIAFVGTTASNGAMTSPDPKLALEGILGAADFRERFARFINSEFNNAPGMSSLEDAPYHIAKRVLSDGSPWSEMFLGKFRLAPIAGSVAVYADSNGLGYFRSVDWSKRYEGNEEQGIKLATAYRIMNNVVGLRLTASTTSANADQTAKGRQGAPCNGCHFDGWFALDRVAAVLPSKGQAFDAYKDGPKEMLGGKQIASDKELVSALVESENFSVNACRLAFKFLYAREDNRCDGPVLDRCVDTFKAKKTMQSALASIAREPGFCE
ncbi:hypothetical protein BH11MYX4_BH11MYX4_29130 [soil metagenome]